MLNDKNRTQATTHLLTPRKFCYKNLTDFVKYPSTLFDS